MQWLLGCGSNSTLALASNSLSYATIPAATIAAITTWEFPFSFFLIFFSFFLLFFFSFLLLGYKGVAGLAVGYPADTVKV